MVLRRPGRNHLQDENDGPSNGQQRPPAEVLYAEELARLAEADEGIARPPGWRLSLPAVRRFVIR